jgi:hypothetical protein
MLSGLEDMIEQERGIRLPQYLLVITGYIGFKYEDRPREKIPKIVEPGFGVGRVHYDFLADIIGFDWHMSEGRDFESAWKTMRELIDSGKPVIMGEMDMFHLPYFKKFYRRIHVPFHYITLTGYDDEKGTALIQDCSRPEGLEISLRDLGNALARDVPGLCKKNAFFWFDFHSSAGQTESAGIVIRKILQKCGKRFLEDKNQGISGLKRLIHDFPSWQASLSAGAFNKSLMYMVTYTCSNTPMPPQKLVFFPLDEVFKKHHAMRERFAALLDAVGPEYGIKECGPAAECFRKSGILFQEMTDRITDYLAALFKTPPLKQGLERIAPLLEKIALIETEGFTALTRII